ncbi:hypothetical protein V8C34DRAFT_284230 [Trichoderma compactum]
MPWYLLSCLSLHRPNQRASGFHFAHQSNRPQLLRSPQDSNRLRMRSLERPSKMRGLPLDGAPGLQTSVQLCFPIKRGPM